MTPPDERTRRGNVARAFGAAPDYDGNARVQRQIARTLAVRIAALDLPASPRVLELGCGTGFLTQAMADIGIGGEWLVTDLAPEMVERCHARLGDHGAHRFAVLDGERETPPGGPFDLICSSLALQWFDDAPAALDRMTAWLAPGGHLMVTTLGPGSFAEWRGAHRKAGFEPGTPAFVPPAAFAAPTSADAVPGITRRIELESIAEPHADAHSFLRAVKAIGAGTASARHRPLRPAALRKVMAHFEASGSSVTYEVVTIHLHRAR